MLDRLQPSNAHLHVSSTHYLYVFGVSIFETGAWHCSLPQEYSLKGLWDAVPMVITFVGAVSFLGVCLAIGIFKYALFLWYRSCQLRCCAYDVLQKRAQSLHFRRALLSAVPAAVAAASSRSLASL